MMSIKTVNSLSHYTNWTIGHVHAGGLGWNGFFIFGMLYWLVPRLWKTKLYSQGLATTHFWLGLIGISLYVISMWISGVSEGLMWKAFDGDGRLVYGSWVDTLPSLAPMYWVRAIGGTLYFTGAIIFVYNLVKTIRQGSPSVSTASAPALRSVPVDTHGGLHRLLEGKPLQFSIWTTVAVLIGGAAEIIPTLAIETNVPTIAAVKPYSPLELEGRDVYIAEGCYVCHSQMVRPFRAETERYGEYSKAGEFVYDHPFQFGSRRIGPDLHRVGGKYPDMWHYNHMLDPRAVSNGSIMPRYPWLFEDTLDLGLTSAKVKAMKTFNVPYTDADVAGAVDAAKLQAAGIAEGLIKQGLPDIREKKIVALIAYLQRLGTDIKKASATATAAVGGQAP